MRCKYHFISKGKHRTDKPRLGIHWKKSIMEYKVTFTTTCEYQTKDPKNQKDINKLFGLSYGLHHKNSARFGWRFNGEKIEILAYVYRDGKRINEWDEDIFIETVDTNKEYTFSLRLSGDHYMFSVSDGESLVGATLIETGKLFPLGYYLNPYFGGDETAPDIIGIKMCKV